MDLAQITGSTSSYARKYALNGMFAIDDTKDSDTTDHRQKDSKPAKRNQPSNKPKTASFSMKDIEDFLALDQPARDKAWGGLSIPLQNAINKAAS